MAPWVGIEPRSSIIVVERADDAQLQIHNVSFFIWVSEMVKVNWRQIETGNKLKNKLECDVLIQCFFGCLFENNFKRVEWFKFGLKTKYRIQSEYFPPVCRLYV